MKKSTVHFAKTTHFSFANESYSFIGSLHERISFRGMNICWEFDTYRRTFENQPMTKAQRIERYEWASCEAGERPFHWSEERWEQHLADEISEAHTDRCSANSWFN